GELVAAFCAVTSCINRLYISHTRSSKYQTWTRLFQASTSSAYQVAASPVRVVPHTSTLVASFASPVMLYTRSHRRRPANQVSNTSISSSPAYFSGGDTLIFLISGGASRSGPIRPRSVH